MYKTSACYPIHLFLFPNTWKVKEICKLDKKESRWRCEANVREEWRKVKKDEKKICERETESVLGHNYQQCKQYMKEDSAENCEMN